jgi:hypothetical protein
MVTSWMLYAAVAATALAAADVFVKMAAGKVPNSLGALLYGAVAFGVGLTWFMFDRARGASEPASQAGVAYALGVGTTSRPQNSRSRRASEMATPVGAVINAVFSTSGRSP